MRKENNIIHLPWRLYYDDQVHLDIRNITGNYGQSQETSKSIS